MTDHSTCRGCYGFLSRDRNLFSCKTKIRFFEHEKSVFLFKFYQNFSWKIQSYSDYLYLHNLGRW